MKNDYGDPVAKLLTYGGYDLSQMNDPWPNYLEIGFTVEHVPDLIRMATDPRLNRADQHSLEVWSPLHAWRTLGQLQTIAAVKPLLGLFEKLKHDDWLSSELPKVFSLIGPVAIPAIEEFMGNGGVDETNRISAPKCIERIALDHPEHREECVGVLANQLTKHATNGSDLNAFIITSLVDLDAKEAIDGIRDAFQAGCVDISVQGDIEDVEIEMGLRSTRSTPPPRVSFFEGLPNLRQREDHTGPANKVGRNDPCPCGSGKKFKKCCLH